MKDREMRIEDLKRRAEGLRINVEWLNRLCAALAVRPEDVRLLSLNETDEIKRAFDERLGASRANAVNWRLEERERLFDSIRERCRMSPELEVALFSPVDNKIGALCASMRCVLAHAQAVWDVVDEDFRITTLDLAHGLCLGIEYYAISGEYVPDGIFELAGWGMFEPR